MASLHPPWVLDFRRAAGWVSVLCAYANAVAGAAMLVAIRPGSPAVHDAGVGFVMVGGENSYGPGGWRGTPVEEMLPVTMDQPQRRVIPNGALVLILHTCEIPDGNFWAKEIGLAALNVLSPKDYMGVIDYGFPGGEQWVFKPTLVGDKAKLAALIRNASPGWPMRVLTSCSPTTSAPICSSTPATRCGSCRPSPPRQRCTL